MSPCPGHFLSTPSPTPTPQPHSHRTPTPTPQPHPHPNSHPQPYPHLTLTLTLTLRVPQVSQRKHSAAWQSMGLHHQSPMLSLPLVVPQCTSLALSKLGAPRASSTMMLVDARDEACLVARPCTGTDSLPVLVHSSNVDASCTESCACDSRVDRSIAEQHLFASSQQAQQYLVSHSVNLGYKLVVGRVHPWKVGRRRFTT